MAKSGDTYLIKSFDKNYMGPVKILEVTDNENRKVIAKIILEGNRKGDTLIFTKQEWVSAEKLKQSGGRGRTKKSKRSKKMAKRSKTRRN